MSIDIRTTLDKRYRIHEAASPDVGRYVMNAVQIIPEDGVAVATDGRILARVPLDLVDAEPGTLPASVPLSVMKAAAKGRKDEPAQILVSGMDSATPRASATYRDSETVADLEQGVFPDYKAVLPAEPDKGGVVTLGINAEHLVRLARALGSEVGGVLLEIPIPAKSGKLAGRVNGCIRVTPLGAPDDDSNPSTAPLGAIMPIS